MSAMVPPGRTVKKPTPQVLPGNTGVMRTSTPYDTNGFLEQTGVDLLQQDPSAAYAMLRRTQGKTGRDKSILAGAREKLYGQAVQLLAGLAPDTDPATISQILTQAAQVLNSGQGLRGMLGDAANARLGELDFGNMDDADILKSLRYARTAALYGGPALGQSGLYGDLDQIEQNAQTTAMTGGDGGVYGSDEFNAYLKRLQALLGRQ